MTTILDRFVPRRLSVEDPGYDPSLGQSLEIRLDGVLQKKVISYDIDRAEIDRYVIDDQGKIVIVGQGDDREIQREICTGSVEVRWKEGS